MSEQVICAKKKKHPILGNLLDSNAHVINHTVLYTWRCWDGEFYVMCGFLSQLKNKGTLGISLGYRKE